MVTVNDAAVQRKCMFLSGEICLTSDRRMYRRRRANEMQTDSANGGNAIGDQAMSADGLFYLGKERSMPPIFS